jgi:hypothetical protein
MINFQLQPFPTTDSLPEIEIIGSLDRSNEILSIEYQLIGDLAAIEITNLSTTPTRKFALWEHTCFEFFLGVPGAREYWEFNLAPSGDWNVFHLDDYRQGLRDELAFTSLPVKIDLRANLLSLRLEFDLSKIISIAQKIEVSIAAVIEPMHYEISYWAVNHSGSAADFHRRDSFILKI